MSKKREIDIMKVQVYITAAELYLEFALTTLDSDETSRDMNNAVLQRTSISFIRVKFCGLGSHFPKTISMLGKQKIYIYIYVSKYAYQFFLEQI